MKTIHLQFIGKLQAKPAKEIKLNDAIIYNYGETSKVLSIIRETNKSIWFQLLSDRGKTYTKQYNKNTLLAFK